MCGRYYRKSDKQKIADALQLGKVDDFPSLRDISSIAPTHN